MKLYVVSATIREVEPLIKQMDAASYKLVITGVGAVAAAYQLTKIFSVDLPALVIQAGIAGSFESNLPLGSVVAVKQDRFADLGVEENNLWTDVFDLRLTEKNDPPFSDGWLVNPNEILLQSGLPLVSSLTINEISTNKKRIGQLQQKYHPALESMEGAALHYVCLQEKIPFIQLRAVSNYTGERDKSKWEIIKAVQNLNKELFNLIEMVTKE